MAKTSSDEPTLPESVQDSQGHRFTPEPMQVESCKKPSDQCSDGNEPMDMSTSDELATSSSAQIQQDALTALSNIPGVQVFRPGDFNECNLSPTEELVSFSVYSYW